MAVVKAEYYNETFQETTLFSVDNTVDLMDGQIEVNSEQHYRKWCRVNIGELSCGVLKERMDDIHMWMHEFIEYSLFMLGMRMDIPEFWNNFPIGTPAHKITSLMVGAWNADGSDVSPEEAARRYGFPKL